MRFELQPDFAFDLVLKRLVLLLPLPIAQKFTVTFDILGFLKLFFYISYNFCLAFCAVTTRFLYRYIFSFKLKLASSLYIVLCKLIPSSNLDQECATSNPIPNWQKEGSSYKVITVFISFLLLYDKSSPNPNACTLTILASIYQYPILKKKVILNRKKIKFSSYSTFLKIFIIPKLIFSPRSFK